MVSSQHYTWRVSIFSVSIFYAESINVDLCYSERCQQEIDRVLDGKTQASFEDRHQMPYVQVQAKPDN